MASFMVPCGRDEHMRFEDDARTYGIKAAPITDPRPGKKEKYRYYNQQIVSTH
jgi:hypothetical protein